MGTEPGGAGVASNGVERRVRGRGAADLLALPVPVAAAPIAVVSFLPDVGHGAWGAEAPAASVALPKVPPERSEMAKVCFLQASEMKG